MSSVGSCLSELRLKHGFSLADMARSTRVTPRYLEALEADKFSDLPPPVFTRGFIRAFCSTLGEPPDTALALYERHLEATEGPRPPASRREAPVSGGKKSAATVDQRRGLSAVFVSFVLLVALGAALFAVVMTLQGRREAADRRDVAMARGDAAAVRDVPVVSVQPAPPVPSPSPAASPGSAASPVSPAPAQPSGGVGTSRPDTRLPPAASSLPPSTPAPAATVPGAGPVASAGPPATSGTAAAPAPTTIPAASVSVPYRLVAKTRALTWLRVRTEGGRGTEENVPAGEIREWVSNRPFQITVGNAGGVSFELNGRPVPSLGADGAVVREILVPSPQ